MDASRLVLVVRKNITALRLELLEFEQTRNNDVQIKYLETSGLLSYSTIVKREINPASTGEAMSNSSPERNKAFVLEAFETLFNKRDYVAAERFWSPSYIQHS